VLQSPLRVFSIANWTDGGVYTIVSMRQLLDMLSINSPFRYAGGKFYARNLIREHLPSHTAYAEPFAGGASIFFYKDAVEKNWLNDLDEDLMRVFRTIQSSPDELIQGLADEIVTRERYAYYRNEFKPEDDIGKAVRWYYLNRTSFSGIMNPPNCFWGYDDQKSMRPENWARNIIRASDKLQGVKLTQLDFEEVIDDIEDEAFLFIDPPYYSADQDKFYACSFSVEDHTRLSEALSRNASRLNFLLTYDNTEEVKVLYDWVADKHAKQWIYTLNRTDYSKSKDGEEVVRGERYEGKEIFIVNQARKPEATVPEPTTCQVLTPAVA
jgi:DNA adenine methylase